jgi:hypothetical protein
MGRESGSGECNVRIPLSENPEIMAQSEYYHELQVMVALSLNVWHRTRVIEDLAKEAGFYIQGRTEAAVKNLYDNELIYVWRKESTWDLTIAGDYYVNRWLEYWGENPA